VQAPELPDQVFARAEVQVIRVAEQDLRADNLQLDGIDSLDGPFGANGHERGCAHLAVRRLQESRPRGAVRRRDGEGLHRHSVARTGRS
jgi:hypothetical protein